jgi:hypothetical protein
LTWFTASDTSKLPHPKVAVNAVPVSIGGRYKGAARLHGKRILLISFLFLCAIPAAAQRDPPKNPQDIAQVFHDIVVGPNGAANVVQCFGCNVYVRGHVTGDVLSGGGSIYISGLVDGNALAVGGHIELRSGGELRGHAAAIGGYVTQTGGGKIDRESVSTPYAIVPGQYRPTALGVAFVIVTNLVCIALACLLLREKRINNTGWTIWNRMNMVMLTGIIALLIAWGFETLGEHLGRAEVPANTLLVLILIVIGAAGATGLGRLVGGVAFPGLAAVPGTLAGIFALSMLEVVPVLGFFVFVIGVLLALGAAIVSGFGARAVPSAEDLAGTKI